MHGGTFQFVLAWGESRMWSCSQHGRDLGGEGSIGSWLQVVAHEIHSSDSVSLQTGYLMISFWVGFFVIYAENNI